jgi:hypothetical protein
VPVVRLRTSKALAAIEAIIAIALAARDAEVG